MLTNLSYKHRMFGYFTIYTIFSMGANFAHPVTPTLFKSLNFPDYMFGYALAVMMILNFLFSPFWGKMNSYLSSRVTLLITCLGYGLGQYFFAIAQTEIQILWARGLAGVFTGGCFVSLLNYVINTAPDDKTRGANLAISASISSVASAFGFFAGGMLGERSVQTALIAQVITLSSSGLLFFIICENDAKMPIKELKLKNMVVEANPLAAFIASGKFMTPLLSALFVMVTMHSAGQVAFDQSFNYYIKDIFDFSSGYSGTLKAAMGIITLVANSTICLYMINKTDVRKSVIYVFALCTVTMGAVVLTYDLVPFLLANIAFYAFCAIGIPLLQKMASDVARDGRDSNLVMGFYNSMKGLGGIMGALFSGAFYALNPKYPFVFSAVAFAIATLCGYIYYKNSLKSDKAKELADTENSLIATEGEN